MSAATIRMFGIVTLLFDAGTLLSVNRQRVLYGPLTSQAIIRVTLYIFFVTLVGVGLLLLRKWAAIVFGLAVVAIPTWMTIELIGQVSWGFYIVVLAVGVIPILCIIVIVRSWPLLLWRGKWFL